jgi:hypothetical protein
MYEPQYLLNYVYLGYHISRLYYPYDRQYTDVVDEVQIFICLTEQLGFHCVASDMEKYLGDLEREHKDNPEAFKRDSAFSQSYGEVLPQQFKNRISEIIIAFEEALNEAGKDLEIVELDRSVVSNALRRLLSHARDEHQRTLVDEAIRCLECGAYRSAIVTGWNLALDHFRQWIFSSPKKRLKELNAILTNKRSKPPKVEHYEDFFGLPERNLIEDAYAAKLFKKNTYNFLIGALGTRNGFAHPSRMVATAASAAGYIDSLIKNVITNPHFVFKTKPVR